MLTVPQLLLTPSAAAAAAAKLLQPCPTLCDPMDSSPPGSSVHGISRQEYWSGLPFPPPGDLPHPGMGHALPVSLALLADILPTEPSGKSQNM